MWVTTLYCAPARRTGKGRGQEGGGVYPEFGVLGIQKGSSPALVREVGRQVALLPSYAMAREELARRGLDLDIKELYGIGKNAGAAALTYRRRLPEAAPTLAGRSRAREPTSKGTSRIPGP